MHDYNTFDDEWWAFRARIKISLIIIIHHIHRNVWNKGYGGHLMSEYSACAWVCVCICECEKVKRSAYANNHYKYAYHNNDNDEHIRGNNSTIIMIIIINILTRVQMWWSEKRCKKNRILHPANDDLQRERFDRNILILLLKSNELYYWWALMCDVNNCPKPDAYLTRVARKKNQSIFDRL